MWKNTIGLDDIEVYEKNSVCLHENKTKAECLDCGQRAIEVACDICESITSAIDKCCE